MPETLVLRLTDLRRCLHAELIDHVKGIAPMIRCDAEFKKKVVLACCDALDREGFTRFRKENVDWPLDADFHCWVGLNSGLYADFVEISPFVGVHVIPIEKLWNSFSHEKYRGKYNRSTATYARHIGELAPDVLRFRFDRSTDIGSEAARLARLYATVGLAFAEAIGDYESLLPLLRRRIDMLGAYPERYACGLYLAGRKTAAKTFVNEFLPAHKEYFEGFARPFLRFIDEHDADCARRPNLSDS